MITKKAAKKAAAKKATTKKASRCTLADACEHLEQLHHYLDKELWPDYRRLRRAVCNLEAAVFDGRSEDKTKRFCRGGPADEPADPGTPPVWRK